MLKQIKYRIGKYFFDKKISKIRRQRNFTNLVDAKTIGLLYTVDNEDVYKIVSEFVKLLQDKYKKNVKALGYIEHPIIPHYCIPKISFDYFTVKDVNWYYKPSNSFVDDFLKVKYDIVIDLTIKDFFPIQYIAGLSPGKFKVGRDTNEHINCYDFMIKIDKNVHLKQFIEIILNYLLIINSKNEQL